MYGKWASPNTKPRPHVEETKTLESPVISNILKGVPNPFFSLTPGRKRHPPPNDPRHGVRLMDDAIQGPQRLSVEANLQSH